MGYATTTKLSRRRLPRRLLKREDGHAEEPSKVTEAAQDQLTENVCEKPIGSDSNVAASSDDDDTFGKLDLKADKTSELNPKDNEDEDLMANVQTKTVKRKSKAPATKGDPKVPP